MCGVSMNTFSLSSVDCLLAAMFLVFIFVFFFFQFYVCSLKPQTATACGSHRVRREHFWADWLFRSVISERCTRSNYVLAARLPTSRTRRKKEQPRNSIVIILSGKMAKIKCGMRRVPCTMHIPTRWLFVAPFTIRTAFGGQLHICGIVRRFVCALCLLCNAAHVSAPKRWGSKKKEKGKTPPKMHKRDASVK